MTSGRPKGYPHSGGRQKGTPNKLPTVRAVFERVFHSLQEDPQFNLKEFAKANPVEFHRLAGKLIPQDVAVQGQIVLNVTTGVPRADEEVEDLA